MRLTGSTTGQSDTNDTGDGEEDTVKCLIRSVQGVYLSASAKNNHMNFGIEKQSEPWREQRH